MNREHWKELLPIITAFVNGEEVQYRGRLANEGEWVPDKCPDFQEQGLKWRIAPKPHKVWVNVYKDCGKLVFKSHATRQDADDFATEDRIACHEIELPPLP